MKNFKMIFLWFLVINISIIGLLVLPAFAGNNDSLPSNPNKGSGKETDLWNYSSQYEGIRLSIYFAPNKDDKSAQEALETGEGIILVGNKVDITKTGPRYYVEEYTDLSIYDYMNKNRNMPYETTRTSKDAPYNYVDTEKKAFVNTMPKVFGGSKELWDNWFESPVNGVNTYNNIPQIAELVGAAISADDFKNGILYYRGERLEGQYKIFFEPIIYPVVNGVSTVMTLRDAIKWEEAYLAGEISNTNGRRLTSNIPQIFVYLANSQFLISPEACISMYPNTTRYQVRFDGTQAAREEIRRQIQPGGHIYDSMGVGVITSGWSKPEGDFDIIYDNSVATDKAVKVPSSDEQTEKVEDEVILNHRFLNESYTGRELKKIEYYVFNNENIVPGDAITDAGKLVATVQNPTSTLTHIKVKVGKKTVIGMKMYFKDGVVFPSGEGNTYGDKYILHHVTLTTGDVETTLPEPGDSTAILRADMRDNERFDVAQGIPSSESLYANVTADEYIYRFTPQKVTGDVEYTVTVEYKESDTSALQEDGSGERGNSSQSSAGEGSAQTTKKAVYNIKKSYSYWDVSSLEVYGIDGAEIINGALPGGKVTLTPKGYKMPEVDFNDIPEDQHVDPGSINIVTTCDSSDPGELYLAAIEAIPAIRVKNDGLIINGKVILSDEETDSNGDAPDYAKLKAPQINRDVLYANNLKIPDATSNGNYASTGSITYKRVFSFNPSGEEKEIRELKPNSVFVHTPVCISIAVSSDDAHNQKPNPAQGTSSLILGRPFTIDISNAGSHRNIKGYGSRDYTKYVKDRQIRAPFDIYLGNSMTGTYLKANTWHSLKGLGIENNVGQLTFYVPTWVDEGKYNIEVSNIALNDSSNGSNVQNTANLTYSNTAAFQTKPVEVSGRVYDLTITDIDDISWETFFRQSKGKADPTGKAFYAGPNNINGVRDPERKYTFPVMPGKNDVKGYQDRAVKLGYAFKFELKTTGNYYDRYDFVQIMPTFAFVDKNGKNRQEVDLYYSTPQKPLVKIGSSEDTLTHSISLDFKYRSIDENLFSKTAEAMYRLRGGIEGYTLDKWKTGFPKISQNGVESYKYFKILLSEPLRTFIGPESGIPQGVDPDKAYASVQKWYGEFRLPADCLAVPKGTDLSRIRNLTRNSPVFLKDGYIVVNFSNISVINDDNFQSPSLKYTGKTGDGWLLEGYNQNQGGWQLLKGDVLAYYAGKRATDDYEGAGTH